MALITQSSVTAKRNIEKIVRRYYDRLFAVINSYTAKAWFAGEEYFNSSVKKSIPKVSKALADKGVF
ncbi:hypothetical protein ACNI5A_33660, partial [Klebsiella pneumoniae]|uniref:hypothetical protein n=1 Tax=Klebsiella pneumoniae TaxID=573 RepID=UPI003A849808